MTEQMLLEDIENVKKICRDAEAVSGGEEGYDKEIYEEEMMDIFQEEMDKLIEQHGIEYANKVLKGICPNAEPLADLREIG